MRIRVAPKGRVERVDQRARLGGIFSPISYSVTMISSLLGLLLTKRLPLRQPCRGRGVLAVGRRQKNPGETKLLNDLDQELALQAGVVRQPWRACLTNALRFFRFLRDNGGLGHPFVLHQRFELREGELRILIAYCNCGVITSC